MRIRILTTDARWSATNGYADDNGHTIITIDPAAVEAVTFGTVPMLRFDLRTVSARLPRDWGNAWAMVPASHAVTD